MLYSSQRKCKWGKGDGVFRMDRHHFERVASTYRNVRNTDPDVIDAIVSSISREDHTIDIAEIACGSGRYSVLITARLARGLRLFCCDYSGAMLAECTRFMSRGGASSHIYYCQLDANAIPFVDSSFDAVVTLNAVHLFDLGRFVAEAARVLRPGGSLCIYTRTPEQNERTIWGQHFPGFTVRETRLYRRELLEGSVVRVTELELEGVREFKHARTESPESLLNRARNFHYSTFALYPSDEFERAMTVFAEKLAQLSVDGKIEHTAENILVLARRK